MDSSRPVTSLEFLTAHKIISRECANLSIDYLECKDAHGHPDACLAKGRAMKDCYNKS